MVIKMIDAATLLVLNHNSCFEKMKLTEYFLKVCESLLLIVKENLKLITLRIIPEIVKGEIKYSILKLLDWRNYAGGRKRQ